MEATLKASDAFSLEMKYRLETGRVLMSGVQALVRLPLDQHRADRRRGLDTATLISGYRGSPLGGLDQTVERHRDLLSRAPGRLHLGRERGPRRHRRARQPARAPVRGRAPRRRARHVVRQGARCRPERRHPSPRELRGHRTARRRARAGRRRSAGQVVDPAHPFRGRVLRLPDAGALPRKRPGHPRPRAPRLRAVALLRALGGLQGRDRRGRRRGHRGGRTPTG